jgi:hypothetical protein
MLSDAAQNDPAMSGQLDYERHDHDFYATPQENVDCLHLVEDLNGTVWWEPACGQGHISKRVEELTGRRSISTDLIDRGLRPSTTGVDFLNGESRQGRSPASSPTRRLTISPSYSSATPSSS